MKEFCLLIVILLITNTCLTQIDGCYTLDTSSYVAVVQSPPEKRNHDELWYKESVYFRIPKNFVLKGNFNIVDFYTKNNRNGVIMNGYSLSDSSSFSDVTDILEDSLTTFKNYLNIRILEFKELYIKPIPDVQYPFGDSIKFSNYPIKLEEVFVDNEKLDFRTVLYIDMMYITKEISFNQIDFWEYIRDGRYIHRRIPCK